MNTRRFGTSTRAHAARKRASSKAAIPALAAAALFFFTACSDESLTAPWQPEESSQNTPVERSSPSPARVVDDLEVVGSTDSTLTVAWTQVDDGAGAPAWYRLEHGESPTDWWSAGLGCGAAIEGEAIGARRSCTVDGLAPSTSYEVRVVSYRMENGASTGAAYSPVSLARTTAAHEPARRGGIWLDHGELSSLPTSGPAWENLVSQADRSCGRPRLSDQDQTNNVCIMAKALVFARTGDGGYLAPVLDALRNITEGGAYSGRALALGRELPAYVIAADLVDLAAHDAELDRAFRSSIRALLKTSTHSGPSNLVECHEVRPNNWGTHCGAARIAVAAYLDDADELERAARVFRGWLGDRSAYAGFSFGDLSWQCDPNRPVGINRRGCKRNGHSIDGVLADDQRRDGRFAWPAPRENYVWEGLQGALAQAVMLDRAGYPAFEWADRALLRAVTWLYEQADYPAEGDDTWQPHIVNHYYGTDFTAPVPTQPGKNLGWSDWTHG